MNVRGYIFLLTQQVDYVLILYKFFVAHSEAE